MNKILFCSLLFFALFACSNKMMVKESVDSPNTLTASEMAEDWELLFNGKNLAGWHGWKKSTPGSKWKVADGTFYFDSKADGTGGDILTDAIFENYELKLDWKIQECGNSGIMFNVDESDKYSHPWHTGPEMQILDNTCHPDSKYPTHRAGDLYDMIECSEVTVKPAGSWNSIRIVSDNGNMQFWQNGVNVVSFTMHTPEWKEMVANSKFKTRPDFGTRTSGHLCLQDHSDSVWFRNVKIREL